VKQQRGAPRGRLYGTGLSVGGGLKLHKRCESGSGIKQKTRRRKNDKVSRSGGLNGETKGAAWPEQSDYFPLRRTGSRGENRGNGRVGEAPSHFGILEVDVHVAWTGPLVKGVSGTWPR